LTADAGDLDLPPGARSGIDSELTAEFEPVLLRRPKGVPDDRIARASYLEGYSEKLNISDLTEETRQEMIALANRRQAAVARRDILEPLEKAGKLTDEQALELNIALELTALSALAHDAGIPITVESEYLPVGLVRGDCRPGT
jgi:hypothetical protein